VKYIIKQLYNNTRHKWYVMLELFRNGYYMLGLIHDWNKYIPWVVAGYTSYSKGDYNKGRDKSGYYRPYTDCPKFNIALHYHVTHSKHHWQYWSMQVDAEGAIPFDIPEKYIIEMLCDWTGASIANGRGRTGAKDWWISNSGKLILHDNVRKYIDRFFNI
jgi:hypothetical protein